MKIGNLSPVFIEHSGTLYFSPPGSKYCFSLVLSDYPDANNLFSNRDFCRLGQYMIKYGKQLSGKPLHRKSNG